MNEPPRNSFKAFTLVELLVVVAVVTLLLILSMPAIQNAMEYSRKVRCINNLKQMHAAIVLAIADNDGKLFRYREGEYGPDGKWKRGDFWSDIITPYLSGKIKTYRVCPAAKKDPETGAFQYAMNCKVSEEQADPRERWQSMSVPSQRFLLTDSLGESRISSWRTECAFRHQRDTANIIFFDGHVESLTVTQIPVPTNGFASTSKEYKAFWLGTL